MLERIIPQQEQLSSDLFSVYSLKDFQPTYLIEEESGLISPTLLDVVSDEIAMEFDRLLNIEFPNEL